LRGVSKTTAKALEVDFKSNGGDRIALLGPNGAGSTFAAHLAATEG